jgi:hypothetical protein
MTNQSHPITPATELLRHWEDQHFEEGENYDVMLIQAYQAGADQELEACCEWVLSNLSTEGYAALRDARRPKPPNLKQQALNALPTRLGDGFVAMINDKELDVIRRAVESLPDDTTP